MTKVGPGRRKPRDAARSGLVAELVIISASGPRKARPPTSGEMAATRLSASASWIPGTARIGWIETNGFEGAMTTRSASAIASSTPGAGAPLGAVEAHDADAVGMAPAYEPFLEVELALLGHDLRPQAVVRGREEPNADRCPPPTLR